MPDLDEEFLRLRFKEFQIKASNFDLLEFSNRIPKNSIRLYGNCCKYLPRQFGFFEDMWKRMSQEERRRKYLSTVLLYEELLKDHASCSPDLEVMILFLRRTFTPLLRFAPNISPQMVSHLVALCRGALEWRGLPVQVGVFLRIVSREDLGVVLESFPTHRFKGWGIQNSLKLMRSLEQILLKLQSVRLIQYGFPYVYDSTYFQTILCAIRSEWLNLKVNGKTIRSEIKGSMLLSGNLRRQLALEIILNLFEDVSGERLVSFFDLLWRAVPYPYISTTEMFTLLKPYFNEKYISLQEVCDVYKNRTLFQVPEVTEPRTLQHLCLVQIRKSLRDANTISDETIDSLTLPKSIQDHLKLIYHRGED